jgi:hypothetical protein
LKCQGILSGVQPLLLERSKRWKISFQYLILNYSASFASIGYKLYFPVKSVGKKSWKESLQILEAGLLFWHPSCDFEKYLESRNIYLGEAPPADVYPNKILRLFTARTRKVMYFEWSKPTKFTIFLICSLMKKTVFLTFRKIVFIFLIC